MTVPARQLLGQSLPDDWDVVSLRWLSRRFAGGTPDKGASSYWENGTIPWLNSGTVNQGVIETPSEYITEEGFASSSAKWIPKGSLVMALAGQGKTKAMVGYLGIDTTGNQSLGAIVPGAIEGKFLYWWLTSQYRHIRNLSSQDGRDGLNLEMIGSIKCPVPPVRDQSRIAAFLDEKTAQIDALIEKKQVLLDRLAEKRQAVITQAVTKGLNPDVPMKDSGVEWLGQIPEHWDVRPFKWQCSIKNGQVDPTILPYSDMILIAPDHVETNTGKLVETQSAFEQGAISGKYLAAPLDVIYSKIRPALRKAVVTDLEALCSADMYAISPGADYDHYFLLYFLLTDAFSAYAELASMRVAMPKVNREALGSVRLVKPTLEEQAQIVDHLRNSLSSVDQATDAVRQSVKTLQEYRSVTITSAVTGRMEVA